MTPELVKGAMTIRIDVVPPWRRVRSGQATAADLRKLSEGAQKLAIHDLALFARQLLVTLNNEYAPEDRAFIAESLRVLAPGELTEQTIARLNGDQPPRFTLTRFADGPPAFRWKSATKD